MMLHSNKEEQIREGLADLIVPKLEMYRRPDGSVEPAWMPVFYNPQGVISRDLTVSFLGVTLGKRGFTFVDPLAGTGIRGIRIAAEVGGVGLVNDINPRAYYYIRKNIRLNKLDDKIEAYNNEANVLLNTLVLSGVPVDYIDVDPYGSPIPFLDSVFKPIGREAFIGITATDTAPLTCTHSSKTLIRYWNKCTRVDFEKEYAARLLIAIASMRASALEVELVPMLTIVYKHYIRVFFKATKSANRAFRSIDKCIGYLWYCKNTMERGFIRAIEEGLNVECRDGSKPAIIGKIWICPIQEPNVINNIYSYALSAHWLSIETAKILKLLIEESNIDRPYVRLDRLCSLIGVNMPNMQSLLRELKSRGIQCSRTHMDPRGVRFSGGQEEFVDILRSIAK
ncbi:MAG: N2,N2-dimethylguanosine tRNA methyltransferase [Desulfurococcaceae archaeon]